MYEGLLKCDMSTGALWRTDGPSGFTPECEKLRNQAHKQIGTLNQYGLNAPVCVNSSDAKYPAPGESRGARGLHSCAVVCDEVAPLSLPGTWHSRVHHAPLSSLPAQLCAILSLLTPAC